MDFPNPNWLTPLPDWARVLFRQLGPNEENGVSHAGEHESTIGTIVDGTRDDTLFKIGNYLRKYGLSQDAIEAALLVINQESCQPPLDDVQVKQKAWSASRYEPNPYAGTTIVNKGGGQKEAEPERQTVTADNITTMNDLVAAGAQIDWLWKGWIQKGVLNAIAGRAGCGKTRFCADLVRRIRHGLPWPDGSPASVSPDALVLWVMSDNHHDEMVTLARDFGVLNSIRVNSFKTDVYGGVFLDDPLDLADLKARIAITKPALVIVDTVGSSTDRNLSKQEEAKAYYQPLQTIARQHRVPILCLTHLNATGHFLGRRVLEKVRIAIRIEQPDEANPKRKLEIHKSNSKLPAPLGLVMGDGGNEYDIHPPEEPQRQNKDLSAAARQAVEWLQTCLGNGFPKRVSNTRREAEAAGISTGALYRARDFLDVEEFETEGFKWWKLTSNFQGQ